MDPGGGDLGPLARGISFRDQWHPSDVREECRECSGVHLLE